MECEFFKSLKIQKKCQFSKVSGEINNLNGTNYCDFHLPVGKQEGEEGYKSSWNDSRNGGFVRNVQRLINMAVRDKMKLDLSGVQFTSGVSFAGLTLFGADFNSSTFINNISFQGAVFYGQVNFNNVKFLANVDFNKAAFNKESEFHLTEFLSQAEFEEVSFAQVVDFLNTLFRGDINFSKSKFQKKSCFTGIRINGISKFEECVFSERVDFSFAYFKENSSFENSEFNSDLKFNESRFVDSSNFSSCRFNNISFEGVRFSNDTFFKECLFLGQVNFSNCYFDKNIDLQGFIFKDKIDFSNSNFLGSLNLNKSIFENEIKFYHTVFDEKVFIEDVWFKKKVQFSNSKFNQSVYFSNSAFDKTADFKGVFFNAGAFFDVNKENFKTPKFQFIESVIVIPKINEINFDGSIFRGTTSFQNRKFSFLTNYSQCMFFKAPNFHNSEIHTNSIFPTLKNFKDTNCKEAAIAYRTLKQFMEQHRARDEEAMFFALEQKSKRNDPDTTRTSKIFSYLYDLFSSYGRNVGRPIAFIFGFICLFWFIYLLFLSPTINPKLELDIGLIWQTFGFIVEQSVSPFRVWRISEIPFGDKNVNLLLLKLIATFQSLLILSLFGLFLITLRWKFKRE
jgi:uncharacterized protein YjbI with pentapeptide repeats